MFKTEKFEVDAEWTKQKSRPISFSTTDEDNGTQCKHTNATHHVRGYSYGWHSARGGRHESRSRGHEAEGDKDARELTQKQRPMRKHMVTT